MDEATAKTKWCPMARIDSDEGGTFNRTLQSLKKWFKWDGKGVYPQEMTNCIGSECMAWRYYHHPEFGDIERTEKSPGYCGAFGKP